MSSDDHRKSFTPELVQSFTAKVIVVCRQTITAKVSHQNWCRVSQQKSQSYVVRQSPQQFHTRTGAKYHSKSHGRMSWDNHRKSFTSELVQSFTAKVMFVCCQIITDKVSHQNWCKVSQQKSCLYVVRQSPQKFHTRTGAKFHSKSHSRMPSNNHHNSFTPELVHALQQKSWLYVVRQSPQKFHTRTGAKFHSKSHGCTSWDNHRGRKLWSSVCPSRQMLVTIFFQIKYVTVGDREYANLSVGNYLRSWKIVPRLSCYRVIGYLISKVLIAVALFCINILYCKV